MQKIKFKNVILCILIIIVLSACNNKIKTSEKNNIKNKEIDYSCKADSDCNEYISTNNCDVICANKDTKNQQIINGLEKTCDSSLWDAPRIGCGCTGGLCKVKKSEVKKDEVKDDNNKVIESGNYLGGDYKGNYVWGGAMNLAWNELNDNILNEKLKLNTNDQVALEMVDKFNTAFFTKNDLDDPSYYIKSGYGQKTVDLINKETKDKFPSKSFADLDIILGQTDILSYAYFLKEVEYITQFTEEEVLFNGEKVKGFYAQNAKQKQNVKILKYWNDDKFIISLSLKDNNDELILAKGFDMRKPSEIINEINKYNNNLTFIHHKDNFQAPEIHLDHSRQYKELMGKNFANKGFTSYSISQMFENVKFDMDYKGARVENEAALIIPTSVEPGHDVKNFIFDQPYWIVMKRKESQSPYFILGVNNIELMKKNK